ncbi:MAG TPA: adenylate/guanylate cyclase domain-containing protein [Allosphingosinicella sp.]|nr:adenylate/guanylate cyclase domain-containing protein [Allosphingosinicella sp.]
MLGIGRRRAATATRRPIIMLAGLAAVLLVALARLAAPALFDQASGLVFDRYQRLSPRPYRDAGVRVVDIDDESIARLGQWPWPRTELAALGEAIAKAGAAAIAYDIVFSEADRTSPRFLAEYQARSGASAAQIAMLKSLPDHDARFAANLAATPSTLGFFLTRDRPGAQVRPKAGFAVAGTQAGASLTDYSGAILPLPQFQESAAGLGFVSHRGDSDGIVRRAPLVARANGILVPSLSAEVLRVAQGAGSLIVRSSDASGETNAGAPEMVGLKIGEAEVPVTERGEIWLHYGLPAPERTVPAWKILSGRVAPAEMERLFSGRIVLVGAGAIGLRDLVATPMRERELGVVVHAQAVEQMVLGEFLERPDWAAGLEMAVLLGAGILLALLMPSIGALPGAFLAGGLMSAVAGGSWYAFEAERLLIDPTAPMLALLGCYLVVTLFTYLREEKQRRYIHGAFDRYLSPELVRRITDDPSRLELGGEVREMTVLFCDIRGFSRISEQMGPQEIIRFLIAFLTPMADLLLARRATIDKYIGDAILAFWNAPLDDPDQHENAARAALEMIEGLERLNETMPERKDSSWPGRVEIGIGLNAGPCCVGNMGSAQRLSYSLIGDTVNLASRIEGLTKAYGVRILMGEELARELPGFATLEVDRVRVVGREKPATIHALLGDENLAGAPAFAAFAERHARFLDDYRGRRWNEAEEALALNAEAAAGHGLALLYARYRLSIRACREHPPGDGWDGVTIAETK